MDFLLFPTNKKKIIESENIEFFINTKEKINFETINYDKNKNINLEIIDIYKNEPDIIIIKFKNTKLLNITKIPKYPIFYDFVFYITPICMQQVNGFSNNNNNVYYLVYNFLERIKTILGGIISKKGFVYNLNNYPNVNLSSGINKLWFVDNIPSWMVKHFPINTSGWFSNYNKLAIDYVYEVFNIENTVELGSYYGLSTKYIANKNKNGILYSADEYRNILLTNYIATTITPIDTKYFFKYIKFESYHKNILESGNKNIYSLKYNCFNVPNLLHKNKIKIDLFYIDFCKKDNLLIKFVDNIFLLYPNCIIIGDDASILKHSLDYFKNKYNYINLTDCYLCSKNIKFTKTEKLMKEYNEHRNILENIDDIDIDVIKNENDDYKILYLAKQINKKKSTNEIIKIIKILNIDPNKNCFFLIQNSNIFNHIAYSYNKDKKYYMNLYKIMDNLYTDKKIKNSFNLISSDYFEYGLDAFF
jgi:hypothetical protein